MSAIGGKADVPTRPESQTRSVQRGRLKLLVDLPGGDPSTGAASGGD
jgi:hypothetical protein